MRALIIRPQMTNPSKMFSMKDYFDYKNLEFYVTEGKSADVKIIELPDDEILIFNRQPNTRDSSKNDLINSFLPKELNDLEIFGTCIIISKKLVHF